MRTKVTAAGCVVTRERAGERELLLLLTLDFSDPTLPKGTVEAALAAMEREEELHAVASLLAPG